MVLSLDNQLDSYFHERMDINLMRRYCSAALLECDSAWAMHPAT